MLPQATRHQMIRQNNQWRRAGANSTATEAETNDHEMDARNVWPCLSHVEQTLNKDCNAGDGARHEQAWSPSHKMDGRHPRKARLLHHRCIPTGN